MVGRELVPKLDSLRSGQDDERRHRLGRPEVRLSALRAGIDPRRPRWRAPPR